MSARSSAWAMVLITAGTLCGLAATDLILPAIPMLPSVVEGTPELAQWVLAGFAAGIGIGLLLFGELGARFRIADVLIVSLVVFSGLSFLATLVESLVQMSVIRFFQGIAAAAPAVYAPVMVRGLYSGPRVVAMMGRIGSIESMAPAIAPIIGAALLSAFGWKSSFYVVAGVSVLLALGWLTAPGLRTQFVRLDKVEGGYLKLLSSPRFLRYALSQACTLGGLLVIVFAAPTVITTSMGGSLSDFIVMQVGGITLFVITANMTGVFARWWGTEGAIFVGSAMSAVGCCGVLVLAIVDGRSIPVLWLCFLLVNAGLGIRGPAGFYQALVASGDDDSRGSALVVFLVMLIAAGGTAAIAPFIEMGLLPVAIGAALISAMSVVTLLATAPMTEETAEA